jgi:hypothetical protein
MCESDGHVYVRLYDRHQQAHYLRLEKSVIHHDSGEEFHAKLDPALGLWPVFLEKAATAFDIDGDFDPWWARYGRISGGRGEKGLAMLLGAQATAVPIAPPAVVPETGVGKRFDEDLRLLFAVGARPNAGDAHATATQVFGATEGLKDWAEWQVWLTAWRRQNPHRDLMTELWQAVRGKQESRWHTLWERNTHFPDTPMWTITQGGVFRLEHLQVWFGRLTPPPPPRLSAKVRAWASKASLLPGKRGTGLYADSQIQLFTRMESLYFNKVPMTVGSRVYVGKSTQDYHYRDEVIKGLVSRHAYAVSGVFADDDGRRYIRLMNPWGYTGRSLTKGEPTFGESQPVSKTQEAEFLLDLDDFTKRFDVLHHTTTPLPPVVR